MNARANHQTLVDRIAQRHAHACGTTEIAHRGESCQQGFLRVAHAAHRVVSGIKGEFLDRGLRRETECQMHVQIDQAGHAGVAAQIDRAAVGDGGIAAINAHDLFIVNDDRALCQHLKGAYVDQATTMQKCRCRRDLGTACQHDNGKGHTGKDGDKA